MNKLLINTPSGEQRIEEVQDGGGYFDSSAVIWDTKTDGVLPDITIGGMIRVGDKLAFRKARKNTHDAALEITTSAKENGKIHSEAKILIDGILPQLIDTMSKLPGTPASLKTKADEIRIKLLELK